MQAINTVHGIIRVGDRVAISGMVKDEWTRMVVEITPKYIKVAGPIKFDLDTLRSRECWNHRITGVCDG